MKKRWGSLKTLVLAKQFDSVEEAQKFLSELKGAPFTVTIHLDGNELVSRDAMFELCGVTKVTFSDKSFKYSLDFLHRKYHVKHYTGAEADVYLTETEERVLYFRLVQDVVVGVFTDTMRNIRTRLGGPYFQDLAGELPSDLKLFNNGVPV